ncbi:MAG: glycosyltransferase family 2 protein [Acidimicrobiales bacterium]
MSDARAGEQDDTPGVSDARAGEQDDTPGVSDLAVVIVNYKSAALTVDCVASLRADGAVDIVVVDNASGDDCRARLAVADPDVTFVGLPDNRGYGAAANAGVARTGGRAVVVSNPDLVVRPGTLAALAGALTSGVGAVGPRIDRPDETRYPSARAFPSLLDAAGHGFVGLLSADNPWSRRYLRPDAEAPGPVDWVSGAFMAVARDAWNAVGGFDESYFMFMEDVDLCWRLHRGGWGVRYEPAGRVMHLEGESRKAAPYRMIVAHHRSLLRYGWRTSTRRDRALMPIVAAGLAVRTIVLCARTAANRVRRA